MIAKEIQEPKVVDIADILIDYLEDFEEDIKRAGGDPREEVTFASFIEYLDRRFPEQDDTRQ